jgi:hypothetical protein
VSITGFGLVCRVCEGTSHWRFCGDSELGQIENHTEDNRNVGDEEEEIGYVAFAAADGHCAGFLGLKGPRSGTVLDHMQCNEVI